MTDDSGLVSLAKRKTRGCRERKNKPSGYTIYGERVMNRHQPGFLFQDKFHITNYESWFDRQEQNPFRIKIYAENINDEPGSKKMEVVIRLNYENLPRWFSRFEKLYQDTGRRDFWIRSHFYVSNHGVILNEETRRIATKIFFDQKPVCKKEER